MTTLHLPTLCTVVGLALAATACDRSDNESPPGPQSQMTLPSPSVDTSRAEATPPTAPPAGPVADAASPAAPPAGMAGPVAGTDRSFLAEAVNSSLAEIEASRLVAGRTADASMRAFAQQLEREHTGTNDELKRIASQKGIDLPSAVAGEARGQVSRLSSLSATELERSFVQDFGIAAHQQAISLFERQAREGQDADLKAFAERTLPKLREHLAMAQQMQSGHATPAPPR